jgi:hypothetical protein
MTDKSHTTEPALSRFHKERMRKAAFDIERMLQPFCSRDWRDWPMTRPFTIGQHTWASNRAILIRVEAIPFVPSYDAMSDDDNVRMMQRLAQHWHHAFREVAMRALTVGEHKPLQRLPNVMIESQPEPNRPICVRFDGGEAIMYSTKPKREPDF